MHFGVIGCGKMGSALLQGVLEAGVFAPGAVTVHDKFTPAMEQAAGDFGVAMAASNRETVSAADVILLAVKPPDMVPLLEEVADVEGSKLFVSIAAGVTLDTMRGCLPDAHRVVRVMPNTPALVGKAASAYAPDSHATEDDASLVEKILGAVGYVTRVDESLLDAVTALSGSGPAYIFAMIESLVAGGVDQGLDKAVALDLATHTVAGAAELLLRTGDAPAALRENVTSPNGTTFAALESLRANQFDHIVREAIKAAKERSVELGG